MLFNSIDFALFLPLVFALFWLIPKERIQLQNLLIVAASYLFYGWWDYRFLSLVLFSTIVDYSIGRQLRAEEKQSKRKLLLWTSITVNLGLLCYFKYYNFFLDNFISAFSLFGKQLDIDTLSVILPVGISFYTFQTLSYTIDVYKRNLGASRDFIGFAAFVSFFPQLVAGPIERATNLLPQFAKERVFDLKLAILGSRQILWGLFKKVVIADNCAEYGNQIFNHSADYSGSTLLLGAILFAFQIYGDFSGYSDIAIGTARLFGFNLMQNFAFPYFSRDIAEFWRRWHISLSTWFRDYLYIPLGGSRGSQSKMIRNVFIIFIVSGFWHGANWTFIVWGTLNALYFLPSMLMKRNRNNLDVVAEGRYLPNFKELFQMGLTFSVTLLAWVFFRAENVNHAFSIIQEIGSASLFQAPSILGGSKQYLTFVLIAFFIAVEWLGRANQFALEIIRLPKLFRYGFYYFIVALIFLFAGGDQQFIYFQF